MKKIILANLIILCACFANINAQSGNKKATTPLTKPIELNINSLDTYKEIVASFDSVLRTKYKIANKFDFIGSWSITLRSGVVVDYIFEENRWEGVVSYTKINDKIGGFKFTYDILYDVDMTKPLYFKVVRIKENGSATKDFPPFTVKLVGNVAKSKIPTKETIHVSYAEFSRDALNVLDSVLRIQFNFKNKIKHFVCGVNIVDKNGNIGEYGAGTYLNDPAKTKFKKELEDALSNADINKPIVITSLWIAEDGITSSQYSSFNLKIIKNKVVGG